MTYLGVVSDPSSVQSLDRSGLMCSRLTRTFFPKQRLTKKKSVYVDYVAPLDAPLHACFTIAPYKVTGYA